MAFSPEELRAYEQIKRLVTRGKHGVEKPVAIVLGGQPGAGKSGLYDIARERFSGNIVELDCDKFRKFHPQADQLALDPATYGEKTNAFVFEVVDRLVEELSDQGFHMIMESSMKSSHTAFQNHELLAPKGYAIEACIMATSKEVSWKGVVDRYNEQLANGELARMVPQEFHDMVVAQLPGAADEIYRSGKMSNIRVYNRDREVLYDMQQTPGISPKATLEERVQGERGTQERSSQQKKPFYFDRHRRSKLRASSAQAKQKQPEKNTLQRGKDAQGLE